LWRNYLKSEKNNAASNYNKNLFKIDILLYSYIHIHQPKQLRHSLQ